MSERAETDHDHAKLVEVVPASHREHHDHSDNVDMRDLVTDTEHLQVSCDWCRAGHVTTVLLSDWSGGTLPRARWSACSAAPGSGTSGTRVTPSATTASR